MESRDWSSDVCSSDLSFCSVRCSLRSSVSGGIVYSSKGVRSVPEQAFLRLWLATFVEPPLNWAQLPELTIEARRSAGPRGSNGKAERAMEKSFQIIPISYGPKTRLSPSAAHFREEWRLRNPPIPRWSVFGQASKSIIGPVHFGLSRRIRSVRLLCMRVSRSPLASELVRQSQSAGHSRGLIAQAAAR